MMSPLAGIARYITAPYILCVGSDFSSMGIITVNCLISPLSAKMLDKRYKARLAAAAAHGGVQYPSS